MRKKIYIAGCGGMLGDAFHKQFNDDFEIKCTDIDLNAEWLSYMDFRDYEAYFKDVQQFQPDYLFHLGAHTDLEYCELNSDDAYSTNTIAVENAVNISNKLDIRLLYISTAGIFDGGKDLYDDWDTPNPLGVYARSKYMGERYVIENASRYLICRAGWMMGGGAKKDKKFIQKLMQQLKDGAQELYVVNDKNGTPTYTHDFANNVKTLLQKEYWGLYNMVCAGETSRLEVATELLNILNLQDKIKLNEVSSDYFKKDYFAIRPGSETLNNKKLQLRKVDTMRDWKVTLKEYLENDYKNFSS
ncbi:MAG: NAD(P)-dependent oxidoreductase [Flavobacteriales bacterium]|nr:NAD(P)-dependent oxidoreductase [Flavobacteriales bacterium]